MIYLDNASTTKPCIEAISAITDTLVSTFGNPSSLHSLGVKAEGKLTAARKMIAASMVADPECIYFTSGATESNNLAINGVIENYSKRRRKIVTTTIEHPSVLKTIKRLEDIGFEVVRIKPNHKGEIEYDSIINAVDNNTCLVSCMYVNNETGAILPIKKAFTYIKRNFPEVITHCDAVQAYMKIPFKVNGLFADIISISSHKVNGPKGAGAIYIKKGIRIASQISGGEQEKGMRSGTENVPAIVGFAAAVNTKICKVTANLTHVQSLRDYFVENVEKIEGVTVLSSNECSPYIVCIAVDAIKSETLLHYLESREIYVSSGSACAKGKKSDVLKSMNFNEKLLDFTIRISFSPENTIQEINSLIYEINQAQFNLQKLKV